MTPHLGRPTSSKIWTNIEAVQRILDEDRRITLRALEERVGMSTATLHSSIRKYLKMSKLSARWVPKLLSEEQKRGRKELLSMYRADKGFLDRIITGDESWFHYYEPESESQSKQWKRRDEPVTCPT